MHLKILFLPGLLVVPVVILSATGGVLMSVFLLAVMLGFAVSLSSSLLAVYRHHVGKPILPAVLVAVVSVATLVSVPATGWPLRMTYAWSRDALETLSKRVRDGEPLTLPVQVGFFAVRQAEISREGIVCLWTDPNPGGRSGFVQTRRNHVPFNLSSMVGLDDRWQFISED